MGGETFISIQNAVNDSNMSMRDKLELLYRLQQTDTAIDKIHLLRGELPLEVQDLEDEISGLKTRAANLEAEIKDLEKEVAQRKIEIEGHKSLLKKYEAQKENVMNNREYESLGREIMNLDLDIERAEKFIRDFQTSSSHKKSLLEETREKISGREMDLENKKVELENIIEETSKDEEQLQKKSDELASKIDTRMLNAYRKVRMNARNRLAVVTVKRDACGGCFNKIPPQRQLDIRSRKKVIVCEYCGRIMIDPELAGVQVAPKQEEAPATTTKRAIRRKTTTA